MSPHRYRCHTKLRDARDWVLPRGPSFFLRRPTSGRIAQSTPPTPLHLETRDASMDHGVVPAPTSLPASMYSATLPSWRGTSNATGRGEKAALTQASLLLRCGQLKLPSHPAHPLSLSLFCLALGVGLGRIAFAPAVLPTYRSSTTPPKPALPSRLPLFLPSNTSAISQPFPT